MISLFKERKKKVVIKIIKLFTKSHFLNFTKVRALSFGMTFCCYCGELEVYATPTCSKFPMVILISSSTLSYSNTCMNKLHECVIIT